MEYQRPNPTTGLIASLIMFVIVALFLLGACGVTIYGVADMTDSVTTNGASVINTWTQESNETTRTRIKWNALVGIKALDVEIAEINADAQKKTDFTFLLFWVTRFLFIAATLCALIAGGIYLVNFLKVGRHEQTTTAAN